MAADFEMNNVFRGDFIIAQTEVIFFKQKKKKKKQPTPKRCILLITHDTVALTDPQKDGKPILMFPRNTITNYRYNDNVDSHFIQYKLEVSVWIKDKTHDLCIEFPTDDAKQQRDIFIQHFAQDKAKPITNDDDDNNTTQPTDNHNNIQKPIHDAQNTPPNNTKSQPPISSKRRGIKRKHETIMNEETLRQRGHKLAKQKHLQTLYKTLVGKNVLTPHAFWSEYGKDIDVKHTSNGLIQGMSNAVLLSTMQRETWSLFTLFKDRENEQKEDGNDDKDKEDKHLLSENILEILVHLPEVKLTYAQNVPHNFTENEFWKSFCQSHYYKRGTTRNVTSGISDKETLMDKLLKEAIVQLEYEEKIKTGRASTPDINHNIKQNESNSFAKQLADMQLAKNKEVDVDGKLKQMREDIAVARAAKNGESVAGDMHKFVERMDHGLIDINIKHRDEDEDMDIEMKDMKDTEDIIKDDNAHNKVNKVSKGDYFKKKLCTLDPSVDLTSTMDSFTEIIQDPGTDENIQRDGIKSWFTQVNTHGMMLLYQSMNQTKSHNMDKAKQKDIQEIMTYVPKINYGRKYKTELGGDNDKTDDDGMIMVMNVETEMEDLKTEYSANYIELNITDQSVYWGDNLLLEEKEQKRMEQVAHELYGYLVKTQEKKKKLSEQDVGNLIHSKYVDGCIVKNTEKNAADNAKLTGDRMVENRKENANGNGNKNKTLMIYGDQRNIKALPKILDQLSAFQKPMTELVRHYWKCFPANYDRLKKAETLVLQLKEYKSKLVGFQSNLAKRSNEFKKQQILLQELIDLADKVLDHNNATQKRLQQKTANRKQLLSRSKSN